VSSPFLVFERFFLLLVLFGVYIAFQTRIVPRHLWATRGAVTAGLIISVTLTLYLGDRSLLPTNDIPIVPALNAHLFKTAAFSPAIMDGNLECVSYNRQSGTLEADEDESAAESDTGNTYSISSDRTGLHYASMTVRDGSFVSHFRSKHFDKALPGWNPIVSPDGDFGAIIRNGSLVTLDLQEKNLAAIDTVSFLPFQIREATFDYTNDDRLMVIVDSLNGSYAIGTYDITGRHLSVTPTSFRPDHICSDGENFFLTKEIADSTEIWSYKRSDEPGTKILTIRASIVDMRILNHRLYFSSDFGRGLNLPTVFEYTGKFR